MIEEIFNYFTIDMLYYWVNLGVIPFWLMLIFFPQSYLCRFLVNSILPIMPIEIKENNLNDKIIKISLTNIGLITF